MNNNSFNKSDYLYEKIDFGFISDDEPKIKKLFSRTHLALFFFCISAYVSLYAVEFIIGAIFGQQKMIQILTNPVYSIVISSICQYAVAFPVFLLFALPVKPLTNKAEQKMKVKNIAAAVCICQSLMLVGGYIGQLLNTYISSVTGKLPENSVDTLVSETPLWLLFITVVILAPIVEELIMRRILIDRLARVGKKTAVIFSAIAFSIFHGNLYQAPYAFLVGLVLGYIYVKTFRVRYTIIVHMIINFIGSVVSVFVAKSATEVEEFFKIISEGEKADFFAYFPSLLITFAYESALIAITFIGFAALFIFIRKGRLKSLNNDEKELYLSKDRIARVTLLNCGVILFYLSCATLIVVNLIL